MASLFNTQLNLIQHLKKRMIFKFKEYILFFLPLSPTIVIGYDVKGPSFAPYILPCGSTGSGLIASSKEIKDGGYLTSDDGKSGTSNFLTEVS